MSWLKRLPTSLSVLLGLSVLIQGIYVFSARSYLLQRLIADDAFYYFKIGLNVAAHHTFTFDGLHLTNGFHPLYQYWVTLLSFLTHDPIVLIRIVLVGAILLSIVTSVLLFAVAKRAMSERAAVLAVTLWALSPAFIRINLLGLENSILAVFLLASLLLFLRLREKGAGATVKDFFSLGVLFGFGFLARIDEIFWIGIATLFLWRGLCSGGGLMVLKKIAAYVAPQLVIVLPFLTYNWLTFHHLFPISGAVKRYQMATWLATNYGSYANPAFLLKALVSSFHQVAQWLGYITASIWAFPAQLVLGGGAFDEATIATHTRELFVGGAAIGLILLVAFAVRMRLRLRTYLAAIRSTFAGRRLIPLVPFFLFTAVHFLSYVVFFFTQIGYADKWYFIPEYLTALILVTVLVESLFLAHRRFLVGLTTAVGMLSGLFFLFHFTDAASPLRPGYRSATVTATKIDAAQWMNANLPADARIGTWNAGLVGYETKRPVTHLEGLVNNYDYLEQYLKPQRVLAYIQREGITYLADYEGGTTDVLTQFYGIPLRYLEPVFRQPGGTTSFHVFRIRQELLPSPTL